ncbi:hypothetical protein ABZW03_40070, partial [Kitasatospora sp. NPDC004799]
MLFVGAPDVVSILAGVNDTGRHTLDPEGCVIPAERFEAGYDRLLAPLAEAGAQLILVEPFPLPVHGVVDAGAALVGEVGRGRAGPRRAGRRGC